MAVAGRISVAAIRVAAIWAVAMLWLGVPLGVSSPAAAHNGVGAAFKGPAGRYTVYAYDGYRLPSGELEYRLILLNTATGEPVENVVPVITATPEGGAGPARSAHVTVLANVVLYDLPNSYPRDWAVTVALSGPLGRGRAQFLMHGQAPYVAPAVRETKGSNNGAWLAAGVAAATAAVVAATYLMLRRRRLAGSV
jgi:hypothetical protein